MPVYRTRPNAEAYGRTIGILLPDTRIPYIQGDPGNAASHGFATLYSVVPGLTLAACSRFEQDLAERVVQTARRLVDQGVRAVAAAGSCMLPYQNVVRQAIGVPTCLSALVQLNLLAPSLHAARPIGVIASAADLYTQDRLEASGLRVANPLRIASMANAPAFAEAHHAGRLDSDALAQETVAAATDLLAGCPALGAILVVPPVLAPYSAAIRAATALPVTDAMTAARCLYAVTRQRAYAGAY